MASVYKCRLCLKTTHKKIDIFKDDFPKMIELLAGIKVNPNDSLIKTSCLDCAKDVKFCMSVRKQILTSYRTLVAQHLRVSQKEQVVKKKTAEGAISKTKKTQPARPYATRTRCLKREKTPESTSGESNDYYSEYSDERDNESDQESGGNQVFETMVAVNLKNDDETSITEQGETVVEEITLIHDIDPKTEDLSSENQENVKLETSIKDEETNNLEDIKEPASPTKLSANRLLNKRNMIAASNRILNQQTLLKDKRYSKVFFVRKSRREKLEEKTQATKIKTMRKKEETDDSNVIMKNGKKYAACEICKKEVKKQYMKYHMTTHFPKHFSCEICGATTRNLRGLRYHKLYWHSSKLDYICDKCGKKYRSNHALDMHDKKEHGGVRDLECNICGKKFFQKMHLKRHVDCIHKKLRPHKCEYCGKDFSKRTHLVTHWRTHTNETPYGCDMCGERFKLKLSLKNHLKRVHNFEEEQKVFCDVCNRGFASEQGLRAHINSRVHEGQKCLYCSEIFTEEYMKNHLREVHCHVEYY